MKAACSAPCPVAASQRASTWSCLPCCQQLVCLTLCSDWTLHSLAHIPLATPLQSLQRCGNPLVVQAEHSLPGQDSMMKCVIPGVFSILFSSPLPNEGLTEVSCVPRQYRFASPDEKEREERAKKGVTVLAVVTDLDYQDEIHLPLHNR
ncbi:hypothetical protein AAY473_013378, partial [Plecturocebus cupreus]